MLAMQGNGAGDDPAAFAAHVIEEQVASIFEALDARASQVNARVRAEAEDIVRGTERTTARPLAVLRAMSSELGALAAELEVKIEARRATPVRGG
jgi:hypothetical protein